MTRLGCVSGLLLLAWGCSSETSPVDMAQPIPLPTAPGIPVGLETNHATGLDVPGPVPTGAYPFDETVDAPRPRGRSARARRFAESLEGLSDQEMVGLFDEARAHAAEESADDGCGRIYAAFSTFMARDDSEPSMDEAEFRRKCESMPPEIRMCLADPSTRSDAENAQCTRLLGTADVLGGGAWGTPAPRGRQPTAEELRQTRERAEEARLRAARGR